jgi:hypothetical protein
MRKKHARLTSMGTTIAVGELCLREVASQIDGTDGVFNNWCRDNWLDIWKEIYLGLHITHIQK